MNNKQDFPFFRGGDGVGMIFDGKSFSFHSNRPEMFRAKITGSSGTDPIAYSWIELEDDASGVGWQENENGRSGTTEEGAAFEFNNNQVPDGAIVWMREKCYSQGINNSVVFEFSFGAASDVPPPLPITTVVTSIQCTGNQLIVGYEEIGG